MKVRAFTVPFAKIVAEDAHELEFGPDDYVVVRPLFGLPSGKAQEWARRVSEVRDEAAKANASGDEVAKDAAGALVDTLILDLLKEQVDAWHLEGPEGRILKPATPDELEALPYAIRAGLFPLFENYRGDAPNPTTGS